MIYMFIKMSSRWYYKEVQSVYSSNALEHISQGEVVAYAEDPETFAFEMGIDEDELIEA